DLTGGGRGRAAVRQSGWRDYPVRDELSAPVPGLRGERLGLPAAGRPAELEYLVRSAVAPSELSVSDRVLELQLVAILDGRRAAGRARRQHQCPRPAQQPLVAARRHDTGPPRHDPRRPPGSGGPGRAGRSDRSSWAEWDGDSRPVVVPALWTNYWRGDGGRSESVNLGSQVSVRIASQFNTTIGVSATHNNDNTQPFDPVTDSTGARHYPVPHLNQKTPSLTG